jgi:hypothetical protein
MDENSFFPLLVIPIELDRIDRNEKIHKGKRPRQFRLDLIESFHFIIHIYRT